MKSFALMCLSFSLFAVSACAHKPATADPASSSASQAKPAGVASGSAAAPADTALTCSKDTDTRVLQVLDKDQGCELKYNKLGKDTVAATGKAGRKHCMSSEEKIRKKLEATGFSCSAKTS